MTRYLKTQFDKTVKAAEHDARMLYGYSGGKYRLLLRNLGGVGTAHFLLRPSPNGRLHDGLIELFSHRALHLSIEAEVLNRRWTTLFSDAERSEARRRLTALDCTIGVMLLPRAEKIVIGYPVPRKQGGSAA